MMENVLLNAGFWHLGKQIFGNLDIANLIKCREVSSIWKNFIDDEFQDLLELKRKYVSIVEKRHPVNRGRPVTFLDLNWNYKRPCDFFKNQAKISDARVFINFMFPFTEHFVDMFLENPFCLVTYRCYDSDDEYSEDELENEETLKEIQKQNLEGFEILKVFLKAPFQLDYIEDRFCPYGGTYSFLLKYRNKIGFKPKPDELLSLVIDQSTFFFRDGCFEEHEELIKEVIDYCRSEHTEFVNQRKIGSRRKDGNTPLHHLQFLNKGSRGRLNYQRFSKSSLRMMFQFYVDHKIDLRTRNFFGDPFWHFENERLPEHYLEVLKEFGLK